jgi:hypothetical protein
MIIQLGIPRRQLESTIYKKDKIDALKVNHKFPGNTFAVHFETTILSLTQNSNRNKTWVVVSLIKNDTGDRIDGFWVSENDPNDWEIMDELFSIAHRSALSIDSAINEMLVEINKKGAIGQKEKPDAGSSGYNGFADDIPF